MFKRTPAHLTLVIKLYIIAIIDFTLFRILLLMNEMSHIGDATFGQIMYAFLLGLQFDFASATFFIIPPAALLIITAFIGKTNKAIEKTTLWLTTILFSLAFLCCGADIPYFHQFFERFNMGAFAWMDGDGGFWFVVRMIAEEPTYWLAIIPVIIIATACYFILRRTFKKVKWEKGRLTSKIIATLIIIAIIALGIHGRIDTKSPIRVGTAFFCNNNFLNQLGLNPNFTLLQSYLEKNSSKGQEYDFMNDEDAINNVCKYLNINEIDSVYPLAREIRHDTAANNYNVVLMIMESMSADKMARHGNDKNLTPFLDSLSYEGLYFDNCYTAGTHTYCGIFASTSSLPVVFRQHPLKHTPILKYDGIATTLKAKGYSTVFFVPHDSQFDNMEGFLLKNDFERVVAKSDYPSEEIKSTMGVPDDYMFRFSIPILDELYAKGKPFLATYMTASDHGPYYIPDYFEGHSDAANDIIVEYADWSRKCFIEEAAKRPWYDKTIFAFIADHGYTADATYPVSMSFIHTPLLFFCPQLIQPATDTAIAGQIDVFPTIMGLLNMDYTNNTMGIDLRRESRPYIFSFADDRYAVLDQQWLLIVDYQNPKPLQLFEYRDKSLIDKSLDYPEKAEEMKVYAESHFQVFQFINKTGKQHVNR